MESNEWTFYPYEYYRYVHSLNLLTYVNHGLFTNTTKTNILFGKRSRV